MLRIDEFKIYENLSENEVIDRMYKKFRINKQDVLKTTICRKSIDSRNKARIHFSYSFNIEVKDEKKYPQFKKIEIKKLIVENKRISELSPVIIGSGPAGLFCALTLIEQGIKPIIVEQGQMIEQRIATVSAHQNERKPINPHSNVQFGEGGAGTFSDGKLTTSVNSPYIQAVLETFCKFGAPKEILYLSKPHIGTDNLVNIMVNIRKYIESKGGKYFFNTKFIDYEKVNNLIRVICDKETFLTDTVVLAVGHSARSVFELLKKKNVNLALKNFAVGVRIEHLQKDIDFAQYGDSKLNLPAAEYKLAYHGKERDCYSFCMCPGGYVMASSSENDGIVTNGMSYYARDGINSNAALLVNVKTSDFSGDDVLSGVYFQRELEHKAYLMGGSNGNAPVQRVQDFINNVKSSKIGKIIPTYQPGYTLANLNDLFPQFISSTIKEALFDFDKKIKGFNDDDAILTAVESRSSSPIIIRRNEQLMMSEMGFYPCGEGAGYAGGITTAAIDGIKVALRIMQNK
ncbi:MAG: FAD-dependent oxidoreductase [Erysipelotrichia bacterium]|nr:FAD-dependent oxidoreductase [Erysipelotrichia bacterium]